MNSDKSGRLDLQNFSEQWKYLTLMAVGTIGALGCGIQVILFPLIGTETNSTAVQYSLGMVLGVPLAKLLRSSQKGE